MDETPNVRLSLPGSAENVLVVRQALTGVATTLALDPIECNDLNTAVTEACNNVVMHAYGGEEGPLEIDVSTRPRRIAVVVRDRGVGIRPPEPEPEPGSAPGASAGMGIPVIHALTRHAEFAERAGGGTEVRMEFDVPNARPLEPVDGAGRASAAIRDSPSGTVELQLAPTAVARAVLPRVLSALAARAYFSTDRIAEVQLLADELATGARESFSGSQLDVGVTIAPRSLALRVGPLLAGGTLELSLVDERSDSH
jgi:serine/threonine-protein kinase RsbW